MAKKKDEFDWVYTQEPHATRSALNFLFTLPQNIELKNSFRADFFFSNLAYFVGHRNKTPPPEIYLAYLNRGRTNFIRKKLLLLERRESKQSCFALS